MADLMNSSEITFNNFFTFYSITIPVPCAFVSTDSVMCMQTVICKQLNNLQTKSATACTIKRVTTTLKSSDSRKDLTPHGSN